MDAIDADIADALARELLDAEDAATTVLPPSERHPGMTVADAYGVQLVGRGLRTARGTRIVGRKVGLTSAAMQELLGVDEPDFGYLTDTMVDGDGAHVALGALVAPRVEAEIAMRLTADVAGADVSFQDAAAAIGEVAPALEVVDSRVVDWRITLADTVADNASSGRAVIGAFRPIGELDLAAVEMEIDVAFADGATVSAHGPGSAVLGHPVNALVWLAAALAPHGEGIAAGEVVIPGAMAAAITLDRPAAVTARFAGLGGVSASFEAAGDGSRR